MENKREFFPIKPERILYVAGVVFCFLLLLRGGKVYAQESENVSDLQTMAVYDDMQFAQAAGAGTGTEAMSTPDERVRYTNPATGYQVIILDDAELLSDEEEAAITEQLKALTAHGNAAIKCLVVSTSFSMSKYVNIHYGSLFSEQSGMLLLIDAQTKTPYVCCGGKLGQMVDQKQAKGIASSISQYISQGQYSAGATAAINQVLARVKQVERQRPVKYVCNAMLALIIAMLINFVLVNALSHVQKTSRQELVENALGYCRHDEVLIEYLSRTETYSPKKRR